MKPLLPSLVCACLVASASGRSTPNIVFIYGDDVGYGDIACYGSGIVPTPRIDSLAASGLRFTNAHSPASTCTPSRYSMLTGEYAWRTAGTGIASGVSPLLIRPGSVTLPSMLRQAGYATAAIGKWHLGLGSGTTNFNANPITPGPLEIGFDRFFGIPATNDRVPCVYVDNRAVANLDPVNDPLVISYTAMVGDEPTGTANPSLLKYYTADAGHSKTIINGISRIGWMDGGVAARWRDEDHADVFVARAGAFIQQNATAGKPFFLYFASADIHVPRAPHERFQGKSPHGWRGDSILSLDWTVGAILDRLADPNKDGDTADSVANNTIVIFTSDNGPVGNDGYNDGSGASTSVTEFPDGHDSNGIFSGGKYSVREGGTRVPCLVRWPGVVPAGVTSDALVSATDFMASFAALTGQALPTDAGPDSENTLPALLGRSAVGREVLVTQNNNQTPKAVRRNDWKYHTSNGALYNLAADPSESTDVAATNPTVLATMRTTLAESEAAAMSSPLTGWWPGDAGTGNEARDLSGLGRSAILSGGAGWATDAGRAHLHFDGVNAAASVTPVPALSGDFTIAVWARSATATFATSGALLARRPAFALVPVAGTTSLRFIVYSGPATPQTLTFDTSTITGFDPTIWHHYAATFDASTGEAAFHVDGVQRATAVFATGGPNSDTGPLFFGSDEGAASFSGDLSDIRVYPAKLAPQRIANTASSRLDDADGDGMLSDWEHRNTLNPFDASDASGDPDGDGLSNIVEFGQGTLPQVPNNSGLLAHWKLDEISGSTADDFSSNSYIGNLINSPLWTAGPGRRFLQFNGTSQHVRIDDLPDLRTQVTAACWARSDTPNWNVAGCLVSRRPQFILHPWLNNTRISFTILPIGGSEITTCDLYLNTIPGFSLTDWHHYAGTYDSATGNVRLYVDGILRKAITITPAPLTSTTTELDIGKDVGRERYFDGGIDDVRIFNRVLSADEVMALTAGFDDDQDGLHDDFERRMMAADPTYTTLAQILPTADPDGDGSDNLEESIAGTDPLGRTDFLRLSSHQIVENEGSKSFSVTLDGRAGRTYTLVQSTTLQAPWSAVQTVGPLATDQAVTLSQYDLPPGRLFFRVEVKYLP